jgi:hypothetical protein
VAVLAIDDHVAEIDSHAHVDGPIVGQPSIALCHAALQTDRARYRIDHAAELGQQSVAHQLEDSALVFGDLRLEQLLSMGPEPLERTRLVLLHEAAVTDYVGSKNGGKMALGAFLGHVSECLWRTESARLYWCLVGKSIALQFSASGQPEKCWSVSDRSG